MDSPRRTTAEPMNAPPRRIDGLAWRGMTALQIGCNAAATRRTAHSAAWDPDVEGVVGVVIGPLQPIPRLSLCQVPSGEMTGIVECSSRIALGSEPVMVRSAAKSVKYSRIPLLGREEVPVVLGRSWNDLAGEP